MTSDRCHHGLLQGMCSICINRESEIRRATEAKKQESAPASPVPKKKRMGIR
jgi:hypothetical protein